MQRCRAGLFRYRRHQPAGHAARDQDIARGGEGWGGEPVVRAYDKKTGAIMGEVAIPA